MPTDLTGTPTSLGIGTYNTAVDAPSGLGFNAAMAQIDALFVARKHAPTRQIFTSGSGTYTTPANVIAIFVECIGGGGGGGGNPSTSAGNGGCGGGGAGAAYANKLIASPAASYAYSVGSGGAGGINTGGAGGTGNNSTFGTTVVVAVGGGGGSGGGSVAPPYATANGGSPGLGSSCTGDFALDGQPGQIGLILHATNPSPQAAGGAAAMGGGPPVPARGTGAGANATGYGAGGTGALAANGNGGFAGGNGAGGIIIVTEFYG